MAPLPGEDVNPNDDKSIRVALRPQRRNVMRVSYEIFSLSSHKIEEAMKKRDVPPERISRIDEMKREKYELIDEQIRLKNMERELKLMLAELTKRNERYRSESPTDARVVGTCTTEALGICPAGEFFTPAKPIAHTTVIQSAHRRVVGRTFLSKTFQ
ncbi:unnamed protein product [Heligmosomoides polygyrus]|uniref:Transposase n=1 Tax=Heligmosomoides polygyrus TaxID=6339 RepID=A0A183F965_HELPZ|nr:unnamed protein product [Heligmosomoides polygyrus]